VRRDVLLLRLPPIGPVWQRDWRSWASAAAH
jgi:hypothetical protein